MLDVLKLRTTKMPFGSHSVFAQVINQLAIRQPKSVLDLGIGYGINGAGVRNWLDHGYEPYRTRLVGVEAFPKYRSPLWNCYNTIHEITIHDYLAIEPVELFDCILMTDVIEHFTKKEGIELLSKLKNILTPSGVLLVSTPAVWIKQGAVHGNEHETHKSLWYPYDFRDYELLMDGETDKSGHKMLLACIKKPHQS